MTERGAGVTGLAAGAAWSVAVLVAAAVFVTIPVFALMPTIMVAFLAPGLVMAAMMGHLALTRFSGGVGDRHVLDRTVEQVVLALAIWPAAAVMLGPAGPGVIVVLGVNFAVFRVVYWIGWYRAPFLRALGGAASALPTVFAAIWALVGFVF